MRPSWPRVEQRQRKEAPLETAICKLIWPLVSLPSGRHSCVETRLQSDVRITLPLQRQRRGICLLRRALFSNKTLWMAASGRQRSAPTTSPGRTRAGKSRRRPEVLDDDWTDELPPEDLELEDQFGSMDAAEAYAVTEFKNASSDMRNATRTFMEAKDLACKRLLPCGRCGCFRWFSNDNAERITTDWRWERYEHWHEQPGRKRTWSWTRKRETPRDSRRPSPAKSRVTSTGAAKGGPAHGTRIQPGQCLLCRHMGNLARGCPNRGTRDDSGINLKRAFGSFMGLTGDRDVSSLVFTTTPQQEVEQGSGFTMSHVPVAVWRSLLIVLEQFLFHWFHRPALSKCKTRLFCWDSDGTRANSTSLLQRSNATSRTVLITENGMKSTKVFHSSTVCHTLNRSAKVTSFRQCTQCPSLSVGVFAEWAAFAVEDVKGHALLDTGASRSFGGHMMVQYVIDCLSRNTPPPWLE